MAESSPRARRFIATVTVASHLALLVSPAFADAPEPSREALAEERKNEAKAEFERGAEDYKQGRYQEAVIAFLSADRLAPSPALSFNIARAYERLNDTNGALRWYRDYLRRKPDAENAREVQERVRALTAALVERGLQQMTVISTPSGAAVTVDGEDAGVTPYTGEHSIGEHTLVLRASDRPERRVTVELDAGAAADFSVNLAEAPVSAAPASAPASASKAPLPGEGNRENDGHERPLGVAPYVVAGAGAALLAGALAFEVARRGQESKAEEAPTQIEFRDRVDRMENYQTTSRVLLGVGSVALVTGGVLYLLNQPREKPAPVAFGCSPFGCAATAQGTF